tara:strand:- start:7070 stop:7708 length:639 start_codon:yes stop_codon:yes gene_type:complete
MDRKEQIDTFSRLSRVSRETITSLKKYEDLLRNANKSLNLIGNSTISNIWERHFLDTFQIIDFIDKNDKSLTDFGSGAGFPGLILAIAAKDRNMSLKITLIEKSKKKINFLNQINSELNLNAKVICKNIFDEDKKFASDVFVARAFKPFQIILELIHNKVEKYNKFFVFLGKSGSEELLQASKNWDIKYKQRMSVTSSDSTIIEINKLKKIN